MKSEDWQIAWVWGEEELHGLVSSQFWMGVEEEGYSLVLMHGLVGQIAWVEVEEYS